MQGEFVDESREAVGVFRDIDPRLDQAFQEKAYRYQGRRMIGLCDHHVAPAETAQAGKVGAEILEMFDQPVAEYEVVGVRVFEEVPLHGTEAPGTAGGDSRGRHIETHRIPGDPREAIQSISHAAPDVDATGDLPPLEKPPDVMEFTADYVRAERGVPAAQPPVRFPRIVHP